MSTVVVSERQADRGVVLAAVLAVLALSLLTQHEFGLRKALLFLAGVGFGISLFHAMFGFTGGWRRIIRERRSEGVRAQILLLALTSLLFFPILGQVFSASGIGAGASAALGPVGVSVLFGAFIFGIGMQLGGGCGSGTLFTVGQGQIDMLVTLVFFIIGATLGSAHLHWWLELPNVGKISLIKEIGWSGALALQFAVLGGLYWFARWVERRRHGDNTRLFGGPANMTPGAKLADRLIFGPWPLWWGVIGLLVFNLITMLLAGHAWSITFAFGLWGAKIWAALGGDSALWPYWSDGYPARALNQSVLKDTTSLMDFGLILGALLAAALAGKFAPAGGISRMRLLAAVVGGLLLGYGARLAFGCNIGALLAGISTGSVHGWLWLVSGFAGSWAGVHLRVYMGLDKPFGAKA